MKHLWGKRGICRVCKIYRADAYRKSSKPAGVPDPVIDDSCTGKPALKKYTIISTNCDCGSGLKAQRNTRFLFGPRCPYCNKGLGPMDYTILGTVKATGDITAIEEWRRRPRQERL